GGTGAGGGDAYRPRRVAHHRAVHGHRRGRGADREGVSVTRPLWADDDERHRPAASGSVRVRVPAKINLHLAVGPRRADGYHEVHTVYHAISLYDELTARPGDTLT